MNRLLKQSILVLLFASMALAADSETPAHAEVKRADKSWWSLQPLAKEFKHDSIDGFIEEKLAEKKLAMNGPAEARSLIRRMSYDVTGLPPSQEEVDAFAKAYQQDSRKAVEALADRLLASPRYGERWGRHWLDIVRFGESNGFERNFIIDDIWPFRDYVIKSINDDKPFDQFIVEHLAGDVIGKDKPEIEVGSTFLVAGPFDDVGNQDVVAQKNIRAATLDDMVTATAGAFLGLTINCGRCHNHKFDPIPSDDYYRLRCAFEGITNGRRAIATKEQRTKYYSTITPLTQKLAALTAKRAKLEKSIEARAKVELANLKPKRPKIDPHLTEESFEPVVARQVKFAMRATTSNPKTAAGSGRLTEFEVWTPDGRNVALARNGGKAEGARSATAEDFPDAYGPQLCIDGQYGEQWFIGSPATLTITLARPETINRITFSNAKGKSVNDGVNGSTPCEYEVLTSNDGKAWQRVASSDDRAPWSEAHAIEHARRSVMTADDQKELAALNRQLAEVNGKIAAVPQLPMVWAGIYSQPKDPTCVFKGGDVMKPVRTVTPSSLSVLDQVVKPYELPADAPEGQRRLALGQWITASDNPLTPRVLANRVWQHHFGVGIVDTPSDFGFLGSRPTHPELLDYLATRLIANGWRLKPLHREILLSKAYQQSAAFRAEAASEDLDARMLWRFPPRRLSAEEIRDTMLAVAGKLQLDPMGGPGFRLYKYTQNNVSTYFPLDTVGPETYRRAVYHENARASIVDVLNDFDLPDTAFAAPKRANTTTPLQSLTMLNHSFTLDLAKSLATRGQGQDLVARVYAFAYQRQPTANERNAAEKLISRFGPAAFCRAILNSNELIYLD